MRTLRFLSVLLAFAFSVYAQTSNTAVNPVVAYAYVGQNTTPGNISAFAVRANGAITRVSGSPFRGPALSLVVSSGYVVGTDLLNITTYTRLSNGALRMSSAVNGVAHNDTPEGSGVGSMTLDRTASTLYASEINFQGADNDAYAEFSKVSGGRLVFRENSPISVNFSSPLQFSQNNRFAYGRGCYFIGWDVFGFYRNTDGTLTRFDPGNTFPPSLPEETLCPGSMAASAKGYLAISYAPVGGPGGQAGIEVMRITSSGALIRVSNLRTKFTGISSIRFDPSGQYLAVAGQGLELFRLNANGSLTLLGAPIQKSTAVYGLQWDKAGHVYGITSTALYVFKNRNGTLSLAAAPVAITKAQSLAVLPTS